MKSFLFAFSLICFTTGKSQLTPAGAGSELENRIWFKSTDIYEHNNSPIESWSNIVDENLLSYQNKEDARPVFKDNNIDNINNQPVIQFDGVNDYLRISNSTELNTAKKPYKERSFYAVIQTSNDIASRQVIYEEGGEHRGLNMYISNNNIYFGAWNTPNQGPGSNWEFNETHVEIAPNTTYILSMRFLGTSSNNGIIACEVNGAPLDDIENVGWMFKHPGAVSIGAQKEGSHYENGGSKGSGHYFNGSMAELIMYNKFMKTSGHHLITNYLSSTYDIPLEQKDLFTADQETKGNFDFDLAGIYRVNDTDKNIEGKGLGNIRISEPTDLDDNEFLIWAHDNGSYEGGELEDIPVGIEARLARNWITQEQGEVGAVNISFDLSNVGAIKAEDLRLLVDTDYDGELADETPKSGGVIEGAINEGNGVFTFQAVNTLNHNSLFSLGSTNLSQTPIPVELLEFTATQNDVNVDLNWSTINETKIAHFELEKLDQFNNWKYLGKVPATQAESGVQPYSFTDTHPVRGENVYRLVKYELDGYGEYVKTITHHFDLNQQFMVYPNPPKDYMTVNVQSGHEAKIHLVNNEGDFITVPETQEEGYVMLDISFLSAGIYVVQVEQNDQVKSKKVIIP